MIAPKAAEPIAAPRYKAELLRASSKFDCAGSTSIALCCWSVKRAAISIAQAIIFMPAAINEELVNSIPAKAHINRSSMLSLAYECQIDRTGRRP